MPPKALAEFREVSKAYPTGLWGRSRRIAAENVSFCVEGGEIFALLGPNRAGKTTLIKTLLSLCRPTTGQVFRFGRPVEERRTLARVGYASENQCFPRYLSARGLLEYYGALALLPEALVRRRSENLLQQVGLADRDREPISRFSKGMTQRLALAQALINDPELLVLDEPYEGLDLQGRQLVRQLVDERRRLGHSVLLVSHVLPEVEEACDRVGLLVAGRLVYCGSTKDLKQKRQPDAARTLEEAVQSYYGK